MVDNQVYQDGDPIPTDDPCEYCKCRPPGFACVLRECEVKPGCKVIRKEGECCPQYQCGKSSAFAIDLRASSSRSPLVWKYYHLLRLFQ